MSDYTCFLHPQQKGASRADFCPECGQRFDFPLSSYPSEIHGRKVVKGISRGFYGAVFLTENSRLGRQYAVKVIPKTTYAPSRDGGYAKDFEAEARLHSELSTIESVARLLDAGEEDLAFGAHTIPCYWIEMEYIDGTTLADKIASSPNSPREVAQIAWDLLDLIGALQQRAHFHNDLHGENILIASLPDSRARRHAIDPHVQVKVLDLGSAASESKSNPARLSDVHWVAEHIITLINAYESSHAVVEPDVLRLCAQLRRVGEIYCGKDPARSPTAADMKSAIEGAYRHGIKPWSQPVRLDSVMSHYNALTLPSWFAPELLYDPGERWARRLTSPGPQLLTGMRGCGKTILLRSLEWVARLHCRSGETTEQALLRAKTDSYLGLFVSCASLLQTPRSTAPVKTLERVFLAFARELVRNLQLCEVDRVGKIDYGALDRLVQLLRNNVPWYERLGTGSDLVSIEADISRAFQNPPANGVNSEFNLHDAFTELAATARQLFDLWDQKVLLFLLDDVSQRFLPVAQVDDLLSRLCLQSPDFGFKVSTESQTLSLTTPGGEPARSGRDYDVFDLGIEVLATIKEKDGAHFIEEVLRRRSQVTDAIVETSPSARLGSQRLKTIAEDIRTKPAKEPVYWGIEALTAICVGDIGDVLQIYANMLDRAGNAMSIIPPDIQHQVMVDFAEQKLFSLAGRDDWLYSHAIAFAAASYQELKESSGNRIREYAEMFVKIAPNDDPSVFDKIIRLIDAGVFVFTGGTPRTKTPQGQPHLQFKLAYRKILGLTNRIPLAVRDRFELSGATLSDWLNAPSANKLRPKGRASEETADEAVAAESMEDPEPPPQQERQPPRMEQRPLFDQQPVLKPATHIPPKVLRTISTVAAGDITQLRPDLSRCHLIGAFGFESRSIGAWQTLLTVSKPASATMIQYRDVGIASQIIELLGNHGVGFESFKLPEVEDDAMISAILDKAQGRCLAVDTTSLTKSLIYLFVLAALRERGEVYVLHTCAETYIPQDDEIQDIIALLETKQFTDAFRGINAIVSGEAGPYVCRAIGQQFRDPSQPSHLAAFVPLKHDRLATLLSYVPVESITAVASIHSTGKESNKSRATQYLARYFVQQYNGSVQSLSSLDFDGTYRLLSELHAKYALESGFNFEIALTGAKMHSVGAAMFAATATPSSVYYSAPTNFDPERFTKGTGLTRFVHLRLNGGASNVM
jgi:serine/threonine protein kinase